jgi:hypothetical protein
VNSAVVHCTLQGFIARLVVRADKGRRAVWNYRVHDVYNATHDRPRTSRQQLTKLGFVNDETRAAAEPTVIRRYSC